MAIGLDDDETPFGLGDDYGADISEAEADALEELIARGAELSGLSEDELTRELEKLVPVHGAPLLLEDGLEALGQARKALEDRDYLDALAAAADGAIELSGLAFGAGTLVKGARLVGKIGARRALDILASLARHGRGPGRDGRQPRQPCRPPTPPPACPRAASRPCAPPPAPRPASPSPASAAPTSSGCRKRCRTLRQGSETSILELIDGGRLRHEAGTRERVVNIQKTGGAAAADAAFEKIVKEHGGDPQRILPDARGVRTFTDPYGTTYTRRVSKERQAGETVSAIIEITRGGGLRPLERELKVRFGSVEAPR